jgi:uncharacterized C2H2 Zn-finger protein
MPIIDDELFVRCRRCGHEMATGIRRTQDGLRADRPGERALTCHRCGAREAYGDADYYHRTVAADRARVEP